MLQGSEIPSDIWRIVMEYIPPNPVTYVRCASISRSAYIVFREPENWKRISNGCSVEKYCDMALALSPRRKENLRRLWLELDNARHKRKYKRSEGLTDCGSLLHPFGPLEVLVVPLILHLNSLTTVYQSRKRWTKIAYLLKWCEKRIVKCLLALDGRLFELCPREVQEDRELAEISIGSDFLARPVFYRGFLSDRAFLLKMIRKCPDAYEFAPSRLRKDSELAKIAIIANPVYLCFHQNNLKDRELVAAACTAEPKLLVEASQELREDEFFIRELLLLNGKIYFFIPAQFQMRLSFVLRALSTTPQIFRRLSPVVRQNHNVYSTAIAGDPNNIQFCKDLVCRKDIMLPLVEKAGYTLKFATAPLRDDEDMALAAVKSYPKALAYVSNRLKNDKSIALTAVQGHAKAYQYIGPQLRSDRQLAKAAIKSGVYALEYFYYNPVYDFPELIKYARSLDAKKTEKVLRTLSTSKSFLAV